MGYKEYSRVSEKLHVGPGGMACTCCCPYNCHPRKAKPLMRRLRRHVEKMRLRESVKEEMGA